MSIRLLLQAATYADQPIRQKYHFHNSYELIFIRKGAIRLTVEQKQYIMSAGSLAIISCLENHSTEILATVYKGNIIKNLIMDCQSYTKYRPNETTGGIFVSWRRKEELPTGA